MSKCCRKRYEPCCEPCCDYGYEGGGMSSYGNIYSLLILILIVCQFCGKCKFWGKDEDEGCGVDNSILFIIAIFVLVYCSCGKKMLGGMGY